MEPSNPSAPHSPNNSRAAFIRRLAYFLIGTAIGLFMLGVINENRKRQRAAATPPAPITPAAP